MKSISVPKSFFESERNHVYARWTAAFWRELLSNSVDANASRIIIRTRFDKNQNYVVDFIDNGTGMDRETIENVYMCLGASTKNARSDGIGGFGRARLLTCFSHDSYRIRTGDLVVQGEGASYSIKSHPTKVPGCALTITTDPDFAARLQNDLRFVLNSSSLRTAIVLDLAKQSPDGQPLPVMDSDHIRQLDDGRQRFSGWTRKGKHFRDLYDEHSVWGQLHVSRGDKAIKNTAIVRVDGMSMYEDHVAAPVQVVVDLVPARAREILTASRDSIRGEFRIALQKVFSEIASEQTSAFRSQRYDIERRLYHNPGHDVGHALPSISSGQLGAARIEQAAAPSIPATSQSLSALPHPEQGNAGEGSRLSIKESSEEALLLRHEVLIDANDPTAAQFAAMSRYDPEKWMQKGGEGRVAELLHAAWTAACRVALEALIRKRPGSLDHNARWSTGFIFDRYNEASYTSVAGLDHIYLLNPVDRMGRMRFKISDPASLNRLAALAIHEVSHTLCLHHDERFAGVMTDIMGDIRGRDMEAAIRGELEIQRDWIKNRCLPEPDTSAPEPF